MNQPDVRALARNTYTLDTVGVLAHLRGVVERHNVTDAWRIR